MKCDKCGATIEDQGHSHCISDLVPPGEKARLDAGDNRVYCSGCCAEVKREWAAVVEEFNPPEE